MAEQTPENAKSGEKDAELPKNTTTNNYRSGGSSGHGPKSRNSNLTTLASAAKSFKGKIEDLPIIGRQYKNLGVTWEILQKDLSKYVVLNLDYRDDMLPLTEDMSDKPEEYYGEAPKWDKVHKDDYGEQQIFSKKIDMFLKREAAYTRNKKKIYNLLFGQCTPSLLSGIKSAEDFRIRTPFGL